VGTGQLFEKILQLNPTGRNVGIDLTEEMLSRARARAKKSGVSDNELRIGDAYHLPYTDSSFDVVINSYMFDLGPEGDFSVILAEFMRVLRRSGRVVLVNMTKGSRPFNAIWEWIYTIRPSLLAGCRVIELEAYLEEVGFQHVRREFIRHMLFPSEVIYGVKP
jgi:ubiquinone/menaquinone biosynthesis C-methylase UbiE